LVAIIEQFREWVQQTVEAFGYSAIFFFMMLENLFPPLPSEIVMPFAGFLVSQNQLSLFGAIASGTLGAATGALIFYYIGYRLGRYRLNRWVRKYGKFLLLKEADLEKALVFFEKHGRKAVLFGRLFPVVRTLISIPAGMNRMPIGTFFVLTCIGSAIWNLILASAGILLGQNWGLVLRILESYQVFLWLVLALLAAIYINRRLKKIGEPSAQA
jgi:membrane protein DedA with SNARE-associated domain